MTLRETLSRVSTANPTSSPEIAGTVDCGGYLVEYEFRVPLGLVLVVCLPDCTPASLAKHLAAAEAMGNRVAIGLVDDGAPALREFIDHTLHQADKAVTVLQSGRGWQLITPPNRIVVVGADTNATIEDGTLRPIVDGSTRGLEAAYSKPEFGFVSLRVTTFSGDLGS